MIIRKIIVGAVLVVCSVSAQAGHLFSQTGAGDIPGPQALTTGQNLDIEWAGVLGQSGSNFDFYLSGFSAGDTLRAQVGNGVNDIVDIVFAGNSGLATAVLSAGQLAAFSPTWVVGGIMRITALTGDFSVAGLVFRAPGTSMAGRDASFGTFVSVPEPGTLGLLGLGLAGMGFARRRRKA